MAQAYIQFINNPSGNKATYSIFAKHMDTLVRFENIKGDLDSRTKAELKEMVLTHISAGTAFAVEKEALANENARLRRAHMEHMKQQRELATLRECFGYD